MEMHTIGVVGAGVMGSDIAYLCARAGWKVVAYDIAPDQLDAGHLRRTHLNDRALTRGHIDVPAAAQLLSRIRSTHQLGDLAICDVIIEAVSERLDIKEGVFRALDEIAQPDALIASNTSGLSISHLAALTKRPSQVVGMHFFNPAVVMQLVELIHGAQSAPETMARAEQLVRALGKTPVRVRECPGFLVNRILVRAMVASYREGAAMAREFHDTDAVIATGGPAPMGPYALGDLIGLDTMDLLQRDLAVAYGDRFHDGGALRAQVSAGRLGRKNARGFVTEDPVSHAAPPTGEAADTYYLAALDEALRCAAEQIAAPGDIDLAMRLGAGWEIGPFAWASEQGVAQIARTLSARTDLTDDLVRSIPVEEIIMHAVHDASPSSESNP